MNLENLQGYLGQVSGIGLAEIPFKGRTVRNIRQGVTTYNYMVTLI